MPKVWKEKSVLTKENFQLLKQNLKTWLQQQIQVSKEHHKKDTKSLLQWEYPVHYKRKPRKDSAGFSP